MRKDAMAITVTTLVMGAFGAFLRWLQNRTAYEDTGLAVPGAAVSTVFLTFCIVMIAGMVGIVLRRRGHFSAPAEGEAALAVNTVIPAMVAWTAFAVFSMAGFRLMFTAGESAAPLMQRLFGAFAILAGAGLPALPCRRGYENISILGRRAAAAILVLFACWWLVFSYRINAQDPVLWHYAPEILAVSAATLAFYYVAGWCFGRAKPDAAVVCLQAAVFLLLCVLPDERDAAMTALLAGAAGVLLLLEFVLLNNMTEIPAKNGGKV